MYRPHRYLFWTAAIKQPQKDYRKHNFYKARNRVPVGRRCEKQLVNYSRVNRWNTWRNETSRCQNSSFVINRGIVMRKLDLWQHIPYVSYFPSGTLLRTIARRVRGSGRSSCNARKCGAIFCSETICRSTVLRRGRRVSVSWAKGHIGKILI